ncbi:hypothetical protein LJC26_02470 [Desulfovibrio sp. OttesenSCG-928-O18]|nr:hypothetical protein [Desulfovibrio sp. OttesenSCG-928-O18]
MYLLVADDITGGNDAGIHFAGRGLDTRMAIAAGGVPLRGPVPEMLIVNTNTRNMTPPDAAGCVKGLVNALKRDEATARPEVVFKKVDSTLRGSPGSEVDVLMRGFGFRTGFLTPAYPQQGRTLKDGWLYINGVPVHKTGFAKDPLMPVKEPSVAAVLARQSRLRTVEVGLDVVNGGPENVVAHVAVKVEDGAELFIFDAETPEQINTIAAAGMRMAERPLFIGASGLAEALASLLPRGTHAAVDGVPPEHAFFVCGSVHPASRAQMDELVREESSVERYAVGDGATGVADSLVAALGRGDALLTTPQNRKRGGRAAGVKLSVELGNTAVAALQKLDINPRSLALVMTGGETSYSVLKDICTGMTLVREIFPGIALGSVVGGKWDGLTVVTKAGGFGSPRTLVDILHLLRP